LHLCHELSRESDLRAYIKVFLLLRKACELSFVRVRRTGSDFAGGCSARSMSGHRRISHMPAIPAKGKLLDHRSPDSSSVWRPWRTSHVPAWCSLVEGLRFGVALVGGKLEVVNQEEWRRTIEGNPSGLLASLQACVLTTIDEIGSTNPN
jgi:hypothetical protein